MKLNSKISLALLTVMATPLTAFAAATPVEVCGYQKTGTNVGGVDYPAGSVIPCGKTDLTNVSKLVTSLTSWILGFAGAVAVLFIIWGGLVYMTAAGNEKRAESAKQTLTYAVIGLIVIILAYAIVGLVSNVIENV